MIKPILVQTCLDDLTDKWKYLEYESKERANEFEEAKDVLEFNDQLEQLDDWLKEKELMLQNGGKIYSLLCGFSMFEFFENSAQLNPMSLKLNSNISH